MTRRARSFLGGLGLNRSMLVRRLVRLGHSRLRTLRARALEGGAAFAPLRALVRWIENGVLFVPQGHAYRLAFDMRHLPLSHAHLGSIAHGTLESAVQEAMIRHLGPGGVLFDIGANVGFFSLLGSRLVGPAGSVYAFEPTPDNVAAIECNVALNSFQNVTVIAKAVSSRPGHSRLYVVDDQSWSRLEEVGEHPLTERVIDVELVAIDDAVRDGKLPPPTVVKIDVEGAEVAVIEGMRETLRDHRPALICELHGTHEEFVRAMSQHGYRLINLEGTIPVQEEGASAHALALPPLHPGD
jgi:FkbM family methyltransferase